MKCYNPFAFAPMVVTITTAVVYLAIFIPIIIIHETVPSAPKNPTVYRGLNLTEAWLDLAELTNGYHPYNSRRNDEVRDWLLLRIAEILDHNGVGYSTESDGNGQIKNVPLVDQQAQQPTHLNQIEPETPNHDELRVRSTSPPVVIFNDLVANYTGSALTKPGEAGRRLGISTYFEGSNIIVYIRGTEDEEGEWWKSTPASTKALHGKGGIMVNAHFDSVSTGYGATDNGVGVVSALQLVKYFTTEGNAPKRGVVALFNNGEEDGLYGAKAFLSHPMATFVHAFLNLEGAGGGGKSMMFRATDTEVIRAYATARHPFGTVVSNDGFALGVVRSETDYIVFRAEGYRGLDVAFWEPRSVYHTDEDDTKHTSPDSLWHMLSASVETMKYLTSHTNEFVGPRGDKVPGKVENGRGTNGVWFDLFGQVLAVFRLTSLFAWTLAILIASPLILMLITFLLVRQGKYYLFSGEVKKEGSGEQVVSLQGWRGAFRFPITLIVSAATTFVAAFLLRKVNPLIIYSSQYSVWAMSLSLFFCLFWFFMAGSNFMRPSALHRVYALLWMFTFGWLLLVAAAVFEDRLKIGGTYMFVIYESAIFLAAVTALCELFALPTKSSVVEISRDEQENRDAITSVPHADALVYDGNNLDGNNESGGAEATETTPLVGGHNHRSSIGATFSRGYRRSATTNLDGAEDDAHGKHHVFGNEQTWSEKLPAWTWLVQFLLIGPFILIVLAPVGLMLVSSLAQTGTDGSPLLLPYLVVALFSVLLILPITPFMHRITHQIPTFLFLVFVGTLIYNLVAFPFSINNRYKAYFQQTVDLDSGINHVQLIGIEEYIREIISVIPSAAGQTISCEQKPTIRDGVVFCSYEGPAPKVVDNVKDGIPPEKAFQDWLTYNVTRVKGENKAKFHISGLETKACIIRFDEPFSAFTVEGAAPSDGKWPDVPETGSDQIKLWHRDWDREWIVDVEWPVSEGKKARDEGRNGRVVCLWSDHNYPGVIPALDEVQRYAPKWTSIVKAMDGLVEGSKPFVI
ncbi:putative zinc metalloprotease [Hyaloscypha hepaticicola]|uniref:Peptide hydrolase n=1 Tax=Hyaloscypha hepaticicola TaxID=2082293 RepID=A0A2J6Q250_9HELO|nr:putative zinc metalloprotease [Hyaloscypha hepaticicola]